MRQATSDKRQENSTELAKSETALREEQVLSFWQSEHIFERSLEKEAPQGDFVFYDGPPFATGLPHMGHLLGSTIKDVVGRYKTMRGYRVPRRWGWDCHGLPIENIVEKKLGLKTKKDIEMLGIAAFNESARESVLTYVADWKRYVERLGRWVDFDHSYKTMDQSYIEGVWGALKKVHDDRRLYEGKKVLMYCPHCETPLAKAEIAMDNSYKEVTDEAVYVKFKLDTNQRIGANATNESPTYILAWTTTPWTLPGNMALAINENIEYIKVEKTVKDDGHDECEQYIVAKERLASIFGNAHEGNLTVHGTVRGVDLVGLAYEPLYETPKAKEQANDKTWTIQAADFVTTEEGTGVVHIAPMYGEDDYELGKKHGLPMVQLLDGAGHYTNDAPELIRGEYYKKGGKAVTGDLEARGLLFARHAHTHSYPHCYRCGTALIYNALSSWFIDIQSVKEKLRTENERVSWYPEHLKHGRFKHILEGAPDWNISRNRYWASPLPIWKHEKTGAVTVIGSLAELRARTKTSGNAYLMVRHGQAENNVLGIVSTFAENEHHLTDTGCAQVAEAVEALRGRNVTRIIASPLVRTKETAELIREALGLSTDAVRYDERLGEWRLGELNGKPIKAIWDVCPSYADRFTNKCAGGETLEEMKRRIGEALYAYEEEYANETILIVGHEYTLWMAQCVAEGADTARAIEIRGKTQDYAANGEVRELDFVPLPHNARYELDLHRPYIDELALVAEDGARLVRIPEVVDCWVESGAMPLASERTLGDPFKKPTRYPGDFIAEYIAQTRTWFYYMHAMGVLLFDQASFKHCVSTGTVLAEDGSKMSKSKGNFTDPLLNIDRYGADALRLYLMGSVVMSAEDMHFKDEELKDTHNRFIGILWNTYKFYETYGEVESRKKKVESDNHEAADTGAAWLKTQNSKLKTHPAHILDQWILARLSQLTTNVTEYLDGYDTVRTVRELRDFVTDLSTWYLRRSRDRLKGAEGEEAREEALATFRHVLQALAKLTAPLAPFIAESMYRGAGGALASVHLEEWPQAAPYDADVLARMHATRQVVSLALERRSAAGVKIRQPLASLFVPEPESIYAELVAEEVNVKEVVAGEELTLDTTVTPELKREGDIRELVRRVQEERKKMGLEPQEMVVLTVVDTDEDKDLLASAAQELRKKAGIETVRWVSEAEAGEFTCLEGKAKIERV